MDLFYTDLSNKISISWDKLIEDLNLAVSYNPYCFTDDYYSIFKKIILSLLTGNEIFLLDNDFSKGELEKLTGQSDFERFRQSLEKNKKLEIPDKSVLLTRLKKADPNWTLTLYTSGTSGVPKEVKHTYQSISRFVNTADNKAKNIWGFAYNPTHMAGIQVFFQALLNGNTLIRLFGLSKTEILESISGCGITNISATPTFYRLLVPTTSNYPSVNRITSGGEKYDERTSQQLKLLFPNAKFTNVYASTEGGTLFASNGAIFTIKPEMEQFAKINESELLIHKSMIGITSMNIDEWYITGDQVEVISRNPLQFRFISRKSDMINVGGYKVNPLEVEEIIRSINGVQDVRIYARSNSVLGSIICCEIVKNDILLDEAYIRHFLQSRLQQFKIPRLIKFVPVIPTTRTGKIKRNN